MNKNSAYITLLQDNLDFMLTHLEQVGYEKNEIILIPPPPSDAEAWKKAWEIRDNVKLDKLPKTNEINRKYYDACVQMGKKHKLTKVISQKKI